MPTACEHCSIAECFSDIVACVTDGLYNLMHFYKCRGPYCVAIETYIAETDEDLTFFVSDVIELIERVDDSWLKGQCGGNIGIFPQSFVEIERDLPPSGMREEPRTSPDLKGDEATSGTTVPITTQVLAFSLFCVW